MFATTSSIKLESPMHTDTWKTKNIGKGVRVVKKENTDQAKKGMTDLRLKSS